jgi:hypothetical protein
LGQKKKDPHHRLQTLERVSSWGTLIILAGILLEVLAFFGLDPGDPRERLSSLIANFLIAVGLIVEYMAIRWTVAASEEAKRESDIENNELKERAAEANARAAEANARATEAQLELVRLRKKVTPREITDAQAEAIVSCISPFAGTPFEVESAPAAEYGFINRLIVVLQRGGWKFAAYSDSLSQLPPGHGGPDVDVGRIQIRFNKSRYDDFLEPSMALARALTECLQVSVSVAGDPEDSPLSCAADAIHVEIRRVV